MTKTFTTIYGLDKRNQSDAGMLYTHDDGTASFCKLHTIHSADTAAIVAHAKRRFSTMGFCFYAVKGSSVVQLMKQGRFAQRDIKALVADGYTEFCYSSAFACKLFMLADSSIVEIERKIDCSPRETTVAALRLGRAMGY